MASEHLNLHEPLLLTHMSNAPFHLKKVEGEIYVRGRGSFYVHKRIPAAIRTAYPRGKTHITRSLNTDDIEVARKTAMTAVAKIQAEFDECRDQLDLARAGEAPERVVTLNESQLQSLLDYWLHQVLVGDDERRAAELDDDEFDELRAHLLDQRADFGRMLARGQVLPFFPALAQFARLCGVSYEPSEDERRNSSLSFLKVVVRALDVQISRMSGEPILTESVVGDVVHPLYRIAPSRAPASPNLATWESVFELWRDQVLNRPRSTTVANKTAWTDLRRFAELHGVVTPSDVTKELLLAFVDDMCKRVAVPTANDRLEMIRKIFNRAVKSSRMPANPAEHVDGKELSAAESRRRKKKRMPFSEGELHSIFSSQVYREHRRSEGQCGEATYWIPLLMFFTGARPEEVAGLALRDLQQDKDGRWHLNIQDHFCNEDDDLFEDGLIPETHLRTLKNSASSRRVPVVPQLLELGLLRYVEFVRASGSSVFFPTLKPDGVGKLSGAFVKVFSRIKKRELQMNDSRKVLYSFRHNMKDLLERAQVPGKVLRRVLGHTLGDGQVTDGYGSDLPFEVIASWFDRVSFPAIPAAPWQPGQGALVFAKGG